VIRDIERFAFLPAVAFAQIITFLVSNDFGKQNWHGISANIKKVVFLASLMVFSLLLIFSLCPGFIIHFFDQKGTFTSFSAKIFPLLSIFVFLDLLQLILSGALRGAGDVRTVMWTRLIVCAGFFCPVTYVVATFFPLVDPMLKFLIIYATFYVGSGIMSIVYVCLFRTGEWSKRSREDKTV
jgi:Na+-driven multidrug efflux pump